MSSARATSEGAYPEQNLPQHLRAATLKHKLVHDVDDVSAYGPWHHFYRIVRGEPPQK
jgi:hypothetical protein